MHPFFSSLSSNKSANKPTSQRPRFFDNVDDSSARQAFLEKGWLMSLVEPKPGQVELRWTPVAGGETKWVGLDYNLLCSMGTDKARAVAWLGLFAAQEDNVS